MIIKKDHEEFFGSLFDFVLASWKKSQCYLYRNKLTNFLLVADTADRKPLGKFKLRSKILVKKLNNLGLTSAYPFTLLGYDPLNTLQCRIFAELIFKKSPC